MKKTGTKFVILTHGNSKVSELIQEILFKMDFGWSGNEKQIKYVEISRAIYMDCRDKSMSYSSDRQPNVKGYTILTLDDLITNNFVIPESIPLSTDYKGIIISEGDQTGLEVGCQFIPKKNLEVLFEKLKASGVLS